MKEQPDFSFYDNLEALERYLNFPPGSLKNIPIYARKPAVDAILKVKDLQDKQLFRPGLYYIVLTDLCANTAFNAKYGDKEADLRVQWFHTAAIESLGEIDVTNYVTFIKTIGDAGLFMFSSFQDVWRWSQTFSNNLESLSDEYASSLQERFTQLSEEELEQRYAEFRMKARRLVHLGEVSYTRDSDPLSLAVSQTFKIEKYFSQTDLGCTQAVADAIRPKLQELGLKIEENKLLDLPGGTGTTMSYYLRSRE